VLKYYREFFDARDAIRQDIIPTDVKKLTAVRRYAENVATVTISWRIAKRNRVASCAKRKT
jgi:ribosomal protein L17